MTYNPGIPLPSDLLANSQGQIQTNFSQANSIFGINHRAFVPVDGSQGKHTIVEMVNQGGDPAGAAGEGTLYTKTSATGSNLFYKDDATNVWQMTRVKDSKVGSFGNFNPGWVFLPGGMILQYGSVASPGTSGSVVFPFTFNSAPIAIFLTVNRANASDSRNSVDTAPAPSTTGFDYVIAVTGATNLYWQVIGN